MRKTLVFVVTLGLMVPAFAAAQDVSLTAGPKAGLNFGWISGSDWKDDVDAVDGSNGVGVGLALGGFLEVGIAEQFAAQPELLFFVLKGKITGEQGGNDYSAVTQLNTVQIPILAKGLFPIDEGTIYGVAGPSIFLVVGDGKATIEIDDDETSDDFEPDNTLLLGLALGAGFEYPLGPGELVGELRYTRVLTRYTDDYDAFGNTVTLFGGYAFPLDL